ncbi:myotubularin-related protein 6-like [Anneissia japonica]|uniref:myotubularin-related protein 6-like n=1 Tax=Anneissia japonica TaxID=1529436 RepID=UPI001425B4FE|nr:myotubularin-related protein 6-like [Anneissia japonica]
MEYITTPKIENVRLVDRFHARKPAMGALYLTATHLIFSDPAGKKETWILHMHVASVEKLQLTTAGSPLQIRCKTFQMATFIIPREKDCQALYKSLQKLSRPGRLEDLYAFHYKSASIDTPISEGWDVLDMESEYARMGIPNENWHRTKINENYQICDTYPRQIYVPTSATTPVLVGSASFRSRGRLPVLSYLHRDNYATITRCSQPLAGFSARCLEDEQMLQAILKSNPKSTFMYVVDTRPKINAMVNKASGKGYENTDFYSNIKFKFIGIENVHVMRNSLQKLVEVCEYKNPTMEAVLSGLESSGWLKHIKAVMDTSLFIAKAVSEEAVSVLVHCSDGWDRTAQTCSLAGMILDPYYRTIQGFQVLVEKEWLAFGHKFLDRCGLINCDSKEQSPVFTQFIEGVWHLMEQFPCAFQFNERFLLEVHDHVYSCQFGTFLGNCEKKRTESKLSERTYSLWGYMRSRMSDYVNPLYRRDHPVTKGILKPNTSPQMFKFWRGMYNRFENGLHPRESLQDVMSAMKDRTSSLADHKQFLEDKVAQLKRLLGKEADTNDVIEQENVEDDANKRSEEETQRTLVNHEGHNESKNRESTVIQNGSHLPRSEIPTDSAQDTSRYSTEIDEILSANLLNLAVESVCLDWKRIRNIRQCSCATPFDHFSRKYHCWCCGQVFCIRCIDKQTPLPGHYSQRPVPVCRPCYKQLKTGSSSPTTPPMSPVSVSSSFSYDDSFMGNST